MVMVDIDENLYNDLPNYIDGLKIKDKRHFVNLAIKDKIDDLKRL